MSYATGIACIWTISIKSAPHSGQEPPTETGRDVRDQTLSNQGQVGQKLDIYKKKIVVTNRHAQNYIFTN